MTFSVAARPTPEPIIRSLWLCFLLTAAGLVLWTVVGPLTSTGGRLSPLITVALTLPVWSFTGRLVAWTGQIGQHVSSARNLQAVARGCSAVRAPAV